MLDLRFSLHNDVLKALVKEFVKLLIYVLNLVPLCYYKLYTLETLKDVYTGLLPNKAFEAIFVAVDPFPETNLEKHFQDVFYCMPWTAIPFPDITSRKYLQTRFGFMYSPYSSNTFVIDSTGVVLQTLGNRCFKVYWSSRLSFQLGEVEFPIS